MLCVILRARDYFGAEKTLIVNCNHQKHANLSKYKGEECIVFDEADAFFVIENKQLLQAGLVGSDIGQSPTMRDARWLFLYDVAMVITCNDWDVEALPQVHQEWIKENCRVVHVTEKMHQ